MGKKYWVITTIVIFMVIFFTGSIVLGIITTGVAFAIKHYWVEYDVVIFKTDTQLVIEWTENGVRERKTFNI